MNNDKEKKFRLYPRKMDIALDRKYNSDPFFNYWIPEEFETMLKNGWKLQGIKRKIRNYEIDFSSCPIHENCWGIWVLRGQELDFEDCGCDYYLNELINIELDKLKTSFPGIEDAVLSRKAAQNANVRWEKGILEYHVDDEIVSAAQLKKKLDSAEPSSPFYHPFDGFDPVDKLSRPISWTIEKFLPDRSLTSIVGEKESMKSFLAIHIALCVATGSSFFGMKTKQGPVLYIAPEGSIGIPVRRDAWMKEHDWFGSFVPFYGRGGSFSLTNKNDKEFLEKCLNTNEQFKPSLVIFDTLGQSIGDADENSASDVNRIARFINDLKINYDCSFIWIDHAGHESKRARGSSAKAGALDAEFFVQRKQDQITITNTKMKDAPRSEKLLLNSVTKHGSIILERAETPPTHADVLIKVISEAQDHTETAIRHSFYQTCVAKTPSAKQKAFQRALEKLVTDGYVHKSNCDKDGELVLKTTSGHTPPPL